MGKKFTYYWKEQAQIYLAAIAGLQHREEIKDTWLKTNYPEIYRQQQHVLNSTATVSTVVEQVAR